MAEGGAASGGGAEGAEAVRPTVPAPSRLQLPAPELDLARLAATLRGVIPRVDEEARERLEAAWVSLTNAMKQPKTDAARLSRRVRRLREELDQWVGRGTPEAADSTLLEPRGEAPRPEAAGDTPTS